MPDGMQQADTGAAKSTANCSTVSASAPDARWRRKAFSTQDFIVAQGYGARKLLRSP